MKVKKMNVLLLSVGTRNSIVHYFRQAFKGVGNIIATDMSSLAPAVYEADKFYQVPCITDPRYIDIILDICKKEEIIAVLTLIDPELSLLAKNEDRFTEIGVQVVGSNYVLCERCLNKWDMFCWLEEQGFHCAKTYLDKEQFFMDVELGKISYPVFVKPICGSASISVAKAYDEETIEFLFSHGNDLMIQEFLDGQEIGADCYIDIISGETVSIFTKKKLAMRAGETDKAVSFKDERLFDLIQHFIKKSGFLGQIDIDIFEVAGEYYFSEVNPRFGGGYPHAYECGCNHIVMIKNNLEGIINKKKIGDYKDGVYMMKYGAVMIK